MKTKEPISREVAQGKVDRALKKFNKLNTEMYQGSIEHATAAKSLKNALELYLATT